MNLGKRIQLLMQSNHISQQQLSHKLNISPSTLNGYIHNKRQPDYSTLIRLASYLNTSTDYLLGYNPQITPTESKTSSQEHFLVDLYRLMDAQGQEMLIETSKIIWMNHKKNS